MYDLIIVGGAMTGATLALALASQGKGKESQLKIALIEKQPMRSAQGSGFDQRAIALSAGSCQKLAQIQLQNGNLWQLLQPISTAIKQICVSDRSHSGLCEFHSEEFSLKQLGAVIGLEQTGELLLKQIQQNANIDYFCPEQINEILFFDDCVKISLKSPHTLTAKLLIGADGGQSLVAKSAHISPVLIRDYQQSAIIANIQVQQSHQYRAFERFTAEGPLALLPMAGNLMSLVWCVKNPEPIMAMNEQQFLFALQQQFGWRLGKLEKASTRYLYPLKLYATSSHIAHRCALVGNSAQTLHPIAGQGFNLAIRDLFSLSQLISQQYLAGKDIGSTELLQQYQQHRQQDQQQMMGLTDNLVSIFTSNFLPLQLGRNLGLIGLAQSKLLRQLFAKPTLGWNNGSF